MSFKYLLKADDDTFICIKRVATFLHDQPEASKDKIYAGVPTACNVPTNPNRHVRKPPSLYETPLHATYRPQQT